MVHFRGKICTELIIVIGQVAVSYPTSRGAGRCLTGFIRRVKSTPWPGNERGAAKHGPLCDGIWNESWVRPMARAGKKSTGGAGSALLSRQTAGVSGCNACATSICHEAPGVRPSCMSRSDTCSLLCRIPGIPRRSSNPNWSLRGRFRPSSMLCYQAVPT
jgi:hypothetical protein